MIIKTPKVHIPLLIAIFTLCVVLALSINKARVKEEAFTLIDTVMTQDWGFVSLTGLFGVSSLSDFGQSPKDLAVGLVQIFPERVLSRIPEIVYSKLSGFPDRPAIERIDIDINFENYQKILEDRRRAMKDNILTNPTEVPAKIRYKGKTHKAKVRLKGDLYVHWRSRTRMSFRVSLKGKKTIKGYKRFSLHKPGGRQYPYDQIFQDIVRESGGLASRHDYVKVFVNGQKWGLMNIEEHMSKELLEKQEAKDSIILKLTNEESWYYGKTRPDPYANYHLSSLLFSTSVYQGNRKLSDPLYRAYYSYVANKFETHKEDDILDVNSFSRLALIAVAWNIFHGLYESNSRFYMNPYTLRLEPVSADQDFFKKIDKESYAFSDLYTLDMPPLFKKALFSEGGLANFQENLDAALNALDKTPEIYDYYQSFFPNNFPVSFRDLESNLDILRGLETQTVPKTVKEDLWREKEKPGPKRPPTPEQAEGFLDHVYVRHYDDGRLYLFNLLDVPVKLEKVLYNGHPMEMPGSSIIPSYMDNDGLFEIHTDKAGLHDKKFEVVTSYGGHVRHTKNEFTLITDTFNPLEIQQGHKYPPFVKKRNGGFLIKSGQWTVRKPLVIHGNLTLKPGAELHFESDAYLIVKGSLVAEGTATSPILLKPLEKVWKGLYVLDSEEESILRHVLIKDTDALQDGLLSLTGGVTFYRADVKIENTEILGTNAEDGLNIVKSAFLIKDSVISDTRSDAFDSDFATGRIISSKVNRVGGDALDFSGGSVLIEKAMIADVRDKAISAGEKSRLVVKDSKFSRVGVGLASKDGSVVTANRIEALDYALYAAMTYVKKDMFGPSELTISQLTHNGTTPFSRQKKTKLTVDGNNIKSQKIDVKELYEGEVMRK